ncbi:MAG: ABC transporter ATP-binding protein, partial [Alphaproteobacteria bacterium]
MTHAPDLCLSLSDIRKNYGTRRVLRGVTRTVPGGICLAITGTNGSGKSTLLKVVAGLLRPSRGEVVMRVGGNEITDAMQRRMMVGYCAPDLALYPELTGAENLRFFADVRGENVSDGVLSERLNAVGLTGRGKDLVSAYSSGMRQRLMAALVDYPRCLPLRRLSRSRRQLRCSVYWGAPTAPRCPN